MSALGHALTSHHPQRTPLPGASRRPVAISCRTWLPESARAERTKWAVCPGFKAPRSPLDPDPRRPRERRRRGEMHVSFSHQVRHDGPPNGQHRPSPASRRAYSRRPSRACASASPWRAGTMPGSRHRASRKCAIAFSALPSLSSAMPRLLCAGARPGSSRNASRK